MNAVFAPRSLALETHLPEALAFLKRLVAANSFTGNRAGVLQSAEIVAEQFQKLGFCAEKVPAENPAFGDHLFLNRPSEREAGRMLVTHLDTVYPAEEEAKNRFEWFAEADRIYGPGVNDNKGGTAMIWLVLATLREAAPDVFEGTHQAECSVNIRAFDESVLQSAIDAIFSLRDGPAAVRAESDGFSCRIGIELLSRNPSWRQNPETDALIEVWMRSAKRIGRSLLAESHGGLSDGNYLSQFLPSLDGLGPFGLRGHSSERSSDGSKVPEYVATSSFLEMGAINVAAIRELMSA